MDIGKTTSLWLAAKGGKVATLSRIRSEGNAVVAAIEKAGGTALVIQTDTATPDELPAVRGRIDAQVQRHERRLPTPTFFQAYSFLARNRPAQPGQVAPLIVHEAHGLVEALGAGIVGLGLQVQGH